MENGKWAQRKLGRWMMENVKSRRYEDGKMGNGKWEMSLVSPDKSGQAARDDGRWEPARRGGMDDRINQNKRKKDKGVKDKVQRNKG